MGGRQPPLGVLGQDRLVRYVLAALAVALLAAGCSGSTSSTPDAAPTPALTAPTSPPATTASPDPQPDPPPPARACYRLGYADALAPTISKKPAPCTGRHTAVNFYVGSYAKNLAVDGLRSTG